MKRGITLIKKWWWVLLLPLLFFLKPIKHLMEFFGFSEADKIRSIANRLEVAMNSGLFYGTNEDGMFDILEVLNSKDLVAVYYAYGNRPYLFGGTNWLGFSLDLFGWFERELSGNDLIKMRNIWSKTDLEITF